MATPKRPTPDAPVIDPPPPKAPPTERPDDDPPIPPYEYPKNPDEGGRPGGTYPPVLPP